MSRSGPILTLLTGVATTVALTAFSITTLPPPPPTATVAVRDDAPPARQGAAEPSPGDAPSTAPADPVSTAPADTPSTAPADPASAAPAARPTRADYATRVQGSRGLLAVSIRGDKAIAYFCDGKTEAWFQGTAGREELLLEGFGGATVNAVIGDTRVSGEFTIGEMRWEFTAPTVRQPSGLYRATALVRGAKLRAGWIYLPDGSRVGAVTLDGDLVPAEIPEPGQPTVIYGTKIKPENVDEFIGDL